MLGEMGEDRTVKIMAKKYITAYDPTIRKRVLFVVKGDWAVSVITGYKFKYDPKRGKKR